jgi:hypothetical protein
MYRLFNRVPKGLEPIAELFKQHVEAEGMQLVRDVAQASESKKDKEAGEWGPGKEGWAGWTAGGRGRVSHQGGQALGVAVRLLTSRGYWWEQAVAGQRTHTP